MNIPTKIALSAILAVLCQISIAMAHTIQINPTFPQELKEAMRSCALQLNDATTIDQVNQIVGIFHQRLTELLQVKTINHNQSSEATSTIAIQATGRRNFIFRQINTNNISEQNNNQNNLNWKRTCTVTAWAMCIILAIPGIRLAAKNQWMGLALSALGGSAILENTITQRMPICTTFACIGTALAWAGMQIWKC